MVSLSLPAPYPGGKSPRYPLGSSLGGAQSRSAVLEKRKISCPCRNSLYHPASPIQLHGLFLANKDMYFRLVVANTDSVTS